MSSVALQKEIAKEILEKLEIVDPSCILAGGAPRNWFFGKEANDLDFYIHLPNETWDKTKLRWKRLGLELEHVDYNSSTWKDYGIMKHLFRIYEMEYKGQKVQVMVMNEPTYHSVVPCFGVSICMFWWKGGNVRPTVEALTSILDQTLYIKDDYSAKEIHVKKQMEYFPEYSVKPFESIDTWKHVNEEEWYKSGCFTVENYLESKANEMLKGEKSE